jgi:hypothetical protein
LLRIGAGDAAAFREQVDPLLDAADRERVRLVMATATLPAHTFEQLRARFPDVLPAFGPGLHKVAPGAPSLSSPLMHDKPSAQCHSFLRKAV